MRKIFGDKTPVKQGAIICAPAGTWSILVPHLAPHLSHPRANVQVTATCTSQGEGKSCMFTCATSHLGFNSLNEEIQRRFSRQFFLGTSFCTLCTLLHLTPPPSSVWSWSQTSPLTLSHSWGCTTPVWEVTLKKHSCMVQHSLLSTYLQLKTTKPH